MANSVSYGFHQLQDIFGQRVAEVNTEVITTALELATQAHVQDMNAMLATLTRPLVGPAKKRIKIASNGGLQPLSQDGSPLPEREGKYYEIAVPFWRGGTSIGGNQEVWAKMTVGELNEKMLGVQRKDADWMIRRILAAVYTNSTWTYQDDDDDIGTLSIKGLASGDTDEYPTLNGTFATDTHYLAQANAISNSDNPLPAMYEELYEHPVNLEPFVLYVNPTDATEIKKLTGFNENPTLSPFVQYGNDTTLATGVDQYMGFGNRVVGECDGFIIVESRRLVANYLIGMAVGGEQPIFMREEPEPTLQGLRMKPFMKNSNLSGFDFYRKAGFAPYNRVGAVVQRVGNGSYAIPTGYNAGTLQG